MSPLPPGVTPIELAVLRIAFAFRNWGEVGGENTGQAVRQFLKLAGLNEAAPWCEAFVSYCGHFGCLDVLTGTSAWPLPLTASCYQAGEAARTKGVLMQEPEPGDQFLLYYDSKGRFGHTGFLVAKNADGTWRTIEGNTNEEGSREGDRVLMKRRTFGPKDRFVRWNRLVTGE